MTWEHLGQRASGDRLPVLPLQAAPRCRPPLSPPLCWCRGLRRHTTVGSVMYAIAVALHFHGRGEDDLAPGRLGDEGHELLLDLGQPLGDLRLESWCFTEVL